MRRLPNGASSDETVRTAGPPTQTHSNAVEDPAVLSDREEGVIDERHRLGLSTDCSERSMPFYYIWSRGQARCPAITSFRMYRSY
jgi:hypothetical protein